MSDTNKSKEQLKHLYEAGIFTKTEYEDKLKKLDQNSEGKVPRARGMEVKKTPTNYISNEEMYQRLFDGKAELPSQWTVSKKPKGKTDPIIFRFLLLVAIVLIAAFATNNPFSGSSSEPVEYSGAASEGDEVYADILDVEPCYGIFRDNGNIMQDYTDVVCKCNTADNKTIWVVIPYNTYIEKFDSSAVNTTLNRQKTNLNIPLAVLDSDSGIEAPKKVLFGSAKKIYGEAEKAENIAEDISNEVSSIVFEYIDYMN